MTGKLLGTVGGSLTILSIYMVGGYAMARYRGWTEYVPLDLIPWFLVFQICGVLLFAAIFMAVGASVTQLKEAQSMLLPVWMLMMSPMFIWFMVIREPNGPLATWFSFFPPATPTMIMLRLSTDATIPTWQPIVGFVVLVIATIFCVYVAARIFRVGLLWQGKTPKLNELIKWAFRG
jgi:ABC-2 type transport system permease protein